MAHRRRLAGAALLLLTSLVAVGAADGGGHRLAFGKGHHHTAPLVPDAGVAGEASTTATAAASGEGEALVAQQEDPYAWDGVASWQQEHNRTLYFEPFAGLGNRLRALASAVVLAQEYSVGLKVIWRAEEPCGPDCNPGFNSSWADLFSEPHLRLADNFPGSSYSAKDEMLYLRAADRDEFTPPLQPGQCLVHQPADAAAMRALLRNNWTDVHGEQVLCVKSDAWLTETAEAGGRFFFRLLKPSPRVASMIQRFKREVQWQQNHMVGVHVRRGDLQIYGTVHKYERLKDVLPLDAYVVAMRAAQAAAVTSKRTRFFLATDDQDAEAAILSAFPPGWVHIFNKTVWSRTEVEGTQQAAVDVFLLAACHELIATYFSSFSATAELMGGAPVTRVTPPDVG